MRVTVSASRGNPLAWPIALLFTVVGLVLIVLGFTVFGKITPDDGTGEDFSSTILEVIAFCLIVPPWIIYLFVLLRRGRRQRDADAGVPVELPEPPSADDPAVVGTVVNKGTASGRAVAATVLGLAARDAIEIQEHGPNVVVVVPDAAAGATTTDKLVLGGLRARADERGHVQAPPLWPDRPAWWGDYVRDARTLPSRPGSSRHGSRSSA